MFAFLAIAVTILMLSIVGLVLALEHRPEMLSDVTGLSASVWLVVAYVYLATAQPWFALVAALFGASDIRFWLRHRKLAAANQ